MSLNSVAREALKAGILENLFSGQPPAAAEIPDLAAAYAAAQGTTLEEAGLSTWTRGISLETGSLDAAVRRTWASEGYATGDLDTALAGVSRVMRLRGQGVGPAAWSLWLDKGLVQKLAGLLSGMAAAGQQPDDLADAAGDVLAGSQGEAIPAASIVAQTGPEGLPAGNAFADSSPQKRGTGSFGSVAFEAGDASLLTWSELARDHKARFAEHQVLGSKPRLEFLAPELSATTLSVRLDVAQGARPAESLALLRDLCAAGRAERLVLGGVNMSLHVLESVRETWRRTGPGGVLLVATAELTLKEYV